MEKDLRKLDNVFGNMVVIIILSGIFFLILRSMYKSYTTKGTICSSCSSCPAINECDKDNVKKDMFDYYKTVNL